MIFNLAVADLMVAIIMIPLEVRNFKLFHHPFMASSKIRILLPTESLRDNYLAPNSNKT